MPPDVLTRNALSLIRCLNRIEQKTPRSATALKGGLDVAAYPVRPVGGPRQQAYPRSG